MGLLSRLSAGVRLARSVELFDQSRTESPRCNTLIQLASTVQSFHLKRNFQSAPRRVGVTQTTRSEREPGFGLTCLDKLFDLQQPFATHSLG